MSTFIDLTGQRFGKLTVLRRAVPPRGSSEVWWTCRCDCGNIIDVKRRYLRNGDSKSCGCLRTKHGQYKTRLYRIWRHMHDRCDNTNDTRFKDYGGRGITVCREWDDFSSFMQWAMSHGYTDTLTIDRIDTNGNYEPNNCRWITMAEQQSNKRNNHLITSHGQTMTMAQWSRYTNIPVKTIHKRLSDGWTDDDAVSIAIGGKRCRA